MKWLSPWWSTIIIVSLTLYLVVSGGLLMSLVSSVWAQEAGESAQDNPKARTTTVTAIVKPRSAPPYPVLIAPANGAQLRGGVVTFEWYAVTGHVAPLDRYELHLNGQKKFGFIHLSNQTTDDYTLTYQDGRYRLQLANDKWLPDGNYTWKIRVVDANDLGSDSSTWTFTIDSQPPPLLVTKIDRGNFNISASDPSTRPSEPVVVTTAGPILSGFSESWSQLQLRVIDGRGQVKQYRTTVDAAGRWSLQLTDLPTDEVVTLTFTVIDPFENTTVYDGLQLVYRPRRLVITLPSFLPIAMTISVRYPRWPWPRPTPAPPPAPPTPVPPMVWPEPSATPLATLPPPTVTVYERPAQSTRWWWAMTLFFWVWYVTLLFIITGNKIGWYGRFWWLMLRFWLGGQRGEQELRDRATLKPVPWVAYRLLWLDAQRRLRRRAGFTTLQGQWSSPLFTTTPGQLVVDNPRWQYPPDPAALTPPQEQLATQETRISLTGQSWFSVTRGGEIPRRQGEVWLTTPDHYRFLAWVDLRHPVTNWWRWLPRLSLGLSFLSALWLAYLVPGWLTLTWLLMICWVGARDIQSQIPHKLVVYTATPREQKREQTRDQNGVAGVAVSDSGAH